MGIDQIKVWFTMVIAAFIVVAGFYFLYSIRADSDAQNGAVALAITGFIGATIQFLFGQVVQSQTAHQTSVAATTLSSNGNGTPAPGTTTTTTTTATPADSTTL